MINKGHLYAVIPQEEGHTRITRADNFTVVGGDKEQHEMTQEYATKFTEIVEKRGDKPMTREEFVDIIHEAGT